MVADSKAVNSLGQMKSYMIMPGGNTVPYSVAGSPARRMADFLESNFWVTAYKENELHSAGEYPNSRGISDGLREWTRDNENLVGKDLVVWYNLGITHMVRPEEWPIMNTHTLGFSLVPFGFFESNPAIKKRHVAKKVIVKGNPVPPDLSLCVPLPAENMSMRTVNR